jgi:hypothetical protein
MKKILVAFTTILCSWLGWWLGDQIGLMTAFLLSMIGTGLGIYLGRRLTQY